MRVLWQLGSGECGARLGSGSPPPPSQGADVHAREDVALRAAVQRGQYEGAALLLQRYGADVHCRWGVGAEALSNG